MSIVSELVTEKLVNMNNDSKTVEGFFRTAAVKLKEAGYVNDTFYEAINEREKVFPTGLQMEYIAVAIPHTDVVHIAKPFIYVNKLVNTQLEFIQMGTDDVVVHPQYIFILGIKNPKAQVDLLSKLIDLFNNKDFVEELNSTAKSEEVINLIDKYQ